MDVWLAHAKPLVQQGMAEIAQLTATHQQDIRNFFQPITPTAANIPTTQ
jgi:ERCC4-related helicase